MASPTPGAGNTKGSGLDTNVASTLCYALSLITGIVFLVLDKDNKEVKFNAWQAILLSIPLVIYQILFRIFWGVGLYTLADIFSFVGWAVYAGTAVLSILAMIKAYQNDRFKIPVIGDIAEQQANK